MPHFSCLPRTQTVKYARAGEAPCERWTNFRCHRPSLPILMVLLWWAAAGAQAGSSVGTDVIAAQFACGGSGGGWETIVYGTPLASGTGSLLFHMDTTGGTGGSTSASTIPPMSLNLVQGVPWNVDSATIPACNSSTTMQGSVEYVGSVPGTLNATYYQNGYSGSSEGTIGATNWLFVSDGTNGKVPAFAVANTTAVPVTLNMSFGAGSTAVSAPLATLAGYGQEAMTVPTVFPTATNTIAAFRLTASGPVAVTSLVFSGPGFASTEANESLYPLGPGFDLATGLGSGGFYAGLVSKGTGPSATLLGYATTTFGVNGTTAAGQIALYNTAGFFGDDAFGGAASGNTITLSNVGPFLNPAGCKATLTNGTATFNNGVSQFTGVLLYGTQPTSCGSVAGSTVPIAGTLTPGLNRYRGTVYLVDVGSQPVGSVVDLVEDAEGNWTGVINNTDNSLGPEFVTGTTVGDSVGFKIVGGANTGQTFTAFLANGNIFATLPKTNPGNYGFSAALVEN